MSTVPRPRGVGDAPEQRPGRASRVETGLALRILLFTLVVPCTLALWGPLAIALSRDFPPRGGVLGVLGGVLVAAGLSLYLSCARRFAIDGRGTPAPNAPPERLVVRGFYRRVRNPMYVGVLTAMGGWTLFFDGDNTLMLCVFWTAVVFHLMVTLYEEPGLRRRFGESYGEYLRCVPRWIPRLRPWAPPSRP